MKWKNSTLALLAAALLVLSACGAKEDGPSIGDLTRQPVGGETVGDTPEPEPETTKGTASNGDKTTSGKGETEEPDDALLAAYKAILERSVEVLSSGGDEDPGEGETGIWEVSLGLDSDEALDSVGYAILDISGDGIPELLIGAVEGWNGGRCYGSEIYAVYTGSHSMPCLALEGWSRSCYRYLGDGRFFFFGSSGAMYSMLGTYVLTENGRALCCEDFYFTYETDETFEKIGIYYNTSGEWDKSISEELDMTYDDFWGLAENWEKQIRAIELTPLSDGSNSAGSADMSGPQVRAMWANGEWNGDYDRIDLSTGEPVSTILFVADSTVTDFQISSLFLESVDDYGNMNFSVTPLYTQDTLTPDWALVVDLTFYGDLPSYGISYVDANRQLWRFAIEISGYDGSIVLTEY